MKAGDLVRMNHPDGYATVLSFSGELKTWIPNGIVGRVCLISPDAIDAVVNFDDRIIATVPVDSLATHLAEPAALTA